MPEQTPLRKFIRSLETKVTDTTTAFEQAWRSQDAAHRAAIIAPLTAGSTTLPGPLETLLRSHGLGDKEIAHINAWPDEPKRRAAAWLAAVTLQDDVAFRWELHGGDNEDVAVSPTPPVSDTGPVTITFRSPQQKVHLSGAPTFGEVNVSV